MGNNPSSQSKPATSSSQPHHTLSVHHSKNHHQRQRDHDSNRDQSNGPSSPRPSSVKREVKHPIPVSHNRVAAPPEPSLAQAQGTIPNSTENKSNTAVSRGRALTQQRSGNTSTSTTNTPTPGSSVASTSTKPIDAKPRPEARKADEDNDDEKPVVNHQDFPSPRREQLSPFSQPGAEAAMMPHTLASVPDVSYLTRPPRLPLPIDQEEQTPGSPILAPADLGQSVEELEALDAEGIASRSSGLSTATLDEDDDVEGLRPDKNRPTVPLRLDWLHGGSKVYVTGTIFQWNRKIRMAQV